MRVGNTIGVNLGLTIVLVLAAISGCFAQVAAVPRLESVAQAGDVLAPICSITLDPVGSISGSSAEYVAASNGTAYVNVGGSLQAVDVQQPALLKHLTNLGSFAYVAEVKNDIAYIAADAGLRIFDMSNPVSPTLRGTYLGITSVVDVAVEGDYAYVIGDTGTSSASNKALHILDVHNLDAPVVRGTYPLPILVGQIAVTNTIAYISTWNGLQILNVGDPDAPVLIKTYLTQSVWGLAVKNEFVYLTGSGYLYVIDMSTPSNPVIRSTIPINGIAYYLQIQGDLVFVAARSGGLQIFDIATPTQPILRSVYQANDGVYDVSVVGTVAYVAVGRGGLELIDISTPSSPALIERYTPPNESYDVAVAGNYAYIADGSAGLKLVDISDSIWLTPRFTYDTPGLAKAVRVYNDRAYVADGATGLLIFDVSNPQNVTLAGFYDTPNDAQAIAVEGEYVYIADGSSLQIVQTHSTGNPTHVATYTTAALDVSIENGQAYVVGGGGSMTILDVQNPAQPKLQTLYTFDRLSAAERVKVVGSIVYVAGVMYTGGKNDPPRSVFAVLEVGNSPTPRELGRFIESNYYGFQALAVANGRAITSSSIFDVQDPAHARLLGRIEPVKNAQFDGQTLYTVAGESGLSIGTLTDQVCDHSLKLPIILR